MEIQFMTMVNDILVEDGVAKGVVTDKGETFYADHIVSGVGREGSEWFSKICKEHDIQTKNGTVDVGAVSYTHLFYIISIYTGQTNLTV